MVTAAIIVACGIDIGLVVLIVATFNPNWLVTLLAFGFGIVCVGAVLSVSRQLYRAGYWQARIDTFGALAEARRRNLEVDDWLSLETERDRARAHAELPFWRRRRREG